MGKHTYTVAMTCGGCSGAITKILTRQKDKGNVKDFEVKLEEKTVIVESDTLNATDVEEILKKAGKAVTHLASV